MIPYIPVGKRSVFSLWRIVILVGAVATPLTAMYMSEAWKKWKNSNSRLTEYFFSTVLSAFLLTAAAMIISAIGILAPLGVPLETISHLLFTRCLFTAVWVVSAAALCSSITSSTGAAALSFGLFNLALLPGLTGASISWWAIAPLGEMVTNVYSAGNNWNITLAVIAHSLVYLLAGFLVLRKTTQLK